MHVPVLLLSGWTLVPLDGWAILPDAVITVTEATADGRPRAARVRFRVPLDDPSLVWTTVAAHAEPVFPPRTYTQPFTLPKEGETVAVPGVMPF